MIRGGLLRKYGDSRHENPAAVIQNISVSDLKGNFSPEPFDGLIDTGCDKSVIPLHVCEVLKLRLFNNVCVYGFDKKIKKCPLSDNLCF